jgi:hypothetical protein
VGAVSVDEAEERARLKALRACDEGLRHLTVPHVPTVA